jgi:hypothetical protein
VVYAGIDYELWGFDARRRVWWIGPVHPRRRADGARTA